MRLNLFIAIATLVALSSNLAVAQTKPAICNFIEQIAAAKANDFATIRGDEEKILGAPSGVYKGKIAPDPHASCTIVRGSVRNGKTTAALYSCEMTRTKTMAGIKASYDQIKSALAQCYPDIQFAEGSKGSDAKHDQTWFVSGHNARITLALQAMDNRFMIDTAPELVNAKTKSAPASLTLRIRPSL
jgi:hypothetical protein